MTTVGVVVRFVLVRVTIGLGLLAVLTVVVYVGVGLLPGDPATNRLALTLPPGQVAAIRARLGLDEPLLVRYGHWVGGLLRGNLGVSYTGHRVADMLAGRVGNSALLAGLSTLLLAPLSLAGGLLAALRRGRGTDVAASTGSLLLVSVPEFVVATILVELFAVTWRVLPAVSIVPPGRSPLTDPVVLVLPVSSLLALGLAYAVRVIRGTAAATLSSPYVEVLRLNGATSWQILRRALVPAVLPVAVQVWLVTGVGFVGGAVLVEQVFDYPGLGQVLTSAAQTGDLPVVQALLILLGGVTLAGLLVADLAATILTPQQRTKVFS